MKKAITKREETTLIEALTDIADSIKFVGRALDRLGTGNAATEMGAIELLASAVKDGCNEMAHAIIRTINE